MEQLVEGWLDVILQEAIALLLSPARQFHGWNSTQGMRQSNLLDSEAFQVATDMMDIMLRKVY